MKRNPVWIGLVSAAALTGALACGDTNIEPLPASGAERIVAVLTGLNENPSRPTTTGYGVVEAERGSGTTITYRLKVARLTNVTQAHIHRGAINVNGPIVADLYLGPTVSVTDTTVLASGTLTPTSIRAGQGTWDELVAGLEGGTMYINVHTTAAPGGDIRGQTRAVRRFD
jgi:hypothetical protein